ncbi:hypothetical protein C1X95_09840 [Pseudomonas sp. FW306-2-11AD]|uniref:Uncharacterized protein n=1 Tax=Pseudomonas fluorescens TaxID=294 RepID=A0A0N9VL50_PSEFL|nr:hypothetical protein AO353_05730 [Pseudomonas fluorescens]PMZ98184.1 hypothetical protein C1X95_09840 [Pseudomonas sp. FW306-2-11AD]
MRWLASRGVAVPAHIRVAEDIKVEAGKLKVVFKHGLIRVEYREVELLARIGKQRNAAFRAGFQQRVLAQQAPSPKPQTPDATKPALGGLC